MQDLKALEGKSLAELREIAKALGIEDVMVKKRELIEKITGDSVQETPAENKGKRGRKKETPAAETPAGTAPETAVAEAAAKTAETPAAEPEPMAAAVAAASAKPRGRRPRMTKAENTAPVQPQTALSPEMPAELEFPTNGAQNEPAAKPVQETAAQPEPKRRGRKPKQDQEQAQEQESAQASQPEETPATRPYEEEVITKDDFVGEIEGEGGSILIDAVSRPRRAELVLRGGARREIPLGVEADEMRYEIEDFLALLRGADGARYLADSESVTRTLDRARAGMGVEFRRR